MDLISERKDALAVLGLAAAGFVFLVVSTSSPDYGLLLPQKERLIWSFARIGPALAWMSLALIAIIVRDSLVWTSAAAAFMTTLVLGCAVAVLGAPIGADAVSIMSSVTYYSLISALLCVTFRSPILAGILGPGLLILQVLTDVLVHVGTGVIQLAW